MDKLLHQETTGTIIGAACEVWRVLGYGFLEKVYENALREELQLRGLEIQVQVPLPVFYKGASVGNYIADVLVGGQILLELKAEKQLHEKYQAQVLNYLKASDLKLAMLINFGESRCEWKRLIL
jgi:GxxExxY protein